VAVAVPIVPAEIAVAVAVPMMVVVAAATVSIPVAFKKAFSVMTRPNPARAGIRRTGPISVMPPITIPGGILVSVYPPKIGAGTRREDADNSWRRRRANSYSDGDLRAADQSAGQKHRYQE
jgi:hypothetical protein